MLHVDNLSESILTELATATHDPNRAVCYALIAARLITQHQKADSIRQTIYEE